MPLMKTLIFATSNANKVREINIKLPTFQVLPMRAIGCTEALPETQKTLAGNALQKARYLHQRYQVDCFSDDTGLLVEVLNGAPGVYSARYAGLEKNANANMNLLLKQLKSYTNRKAYFKTVIALILDGKEHLFEGSVQGHIHTKKRGKSGFGYDPIFIPDGYVTTFAEMSLKQKNAISHRGKAVEQLITFLERL